MVNEAESVADQDLDWVHVSGMMGTKGQMSGSGNQSPSLWLYVVVCHGLILHQCCVLPQKIAQ